MLLTLLAICIGIDMRRNNKIYSQGEDMLQCRNSELRSYTKDVFINGEKINTTDMLVNKEKALYNKYIVVRRGKKKYYLVIFN